MEPLAVSITKKSEKIDDSTQSLLLANLIKALSELSQVGDGRLRLLSLSGNSYSEKACEEVASVLAAFKHVQVFFRVLWL